MSILAKLLANRQQRMQSSAEVAPMFNVVPESDGSPAEILFYGDVFEETPRSWWTGEPIDGMHISVEDMVTKISEIGDAKEVLIRLNSSGGDLFAGITLHNLIKGLPGKKTVRVEGLAASAASLIMCAGDTVELYPASMVMVHNAASIVYDYLTTQDVRELLDMHEKAEAAMTKIYAARTGKSKEECQALIDSTTWMVGQEAIDQGFADELIEEAYEEGNGEDPIDPDVIDSLNPSLSADGHYLMIAGVRHSLAGIDTLPSFLTAHNSGFHTVEAVGNSKAVREPIAHEESKEDVLENITTEAVLREAYPDLVASIEAEAQAAERARLSAIDTIANRIADAEMVAKARYEEPKTAEALLMDAVSADKLVNVGFLNAVEEDGKDSNTDDVTPDPAEDEADEEKKNEDEMVNAAVKIFNSRGGRK